MTSELVLIHGRGIKPRRAVKQSLALASINHALAREGFAPLPTLKLVYYGDLNAAVLQVLARKQINDVERYDVLNPHEPLEYEADSEFDEALLKLQHLTVSDFTRSAYLKARGHLSLRGTWDEAARVGGRLVEIVGLSSNLLARMAPELALYFARPFMRELLLERATRAVLPFLYAGKAVNLVGHSMGSVVAYELLHRLSDARRYPRLVDSRKIRLLTLGSPLADPSVLSEMTARNTLGIPSLVSSWLNLSAEDDHICHASQLRKKYVDSSGAVQVEDQEIYNYFVHPKYGRNPHKLYGYLDQPRVARWLCE